MGEKVAAGGLCRHIGDMADSSCEKPGHQIADAKPESHRDEASDPEEQGAVGRGRLRIVVQVFRDILHADDLLAVPLDRFLEQRSQVDRERQDAECSHLFGLSGGQQLFIETVAHGADGALSILEVPLQRRFQQGHVF